MAIRNDGLWRAPCVCGIGEWNNHSLLPNWLVSSLLIRAGDSGRSVSSPGQYRGTGNEMFHPYNGPDERCNSNESSQGTYALSSLTYSQYDNAVETIALTIHKQAHIPKGRSQADHSSLVGSPGSLKTVPESTSIVTITAIYMNEILSGNTLRSAYRTHLSDRPGYAPQQHDIGLPRLDC